jgi:capsular exopolysaccharide synthesis family protein
MNKNQKSAVLKTAGDMKDTKSSSDVDDASVQDIIDEIGIAFKDLENKDAGFKSSVYSPHIVNTNMRSKRNVKKLSKRGKINWMKAFAEAPFQYQEAFFALRTNLNFLSATGNMKRIIITSSLSGEGKTSIAVNLSLALSAADHKVILIDADLRRPLIHKYLRLPDGGKTGLTSILQSKDGSTEGCMHHKIDKKGLSVIPCGVIPPNPAELLGSPRMGKIVEQLGDLYDYLIIDTPPVAVVTDAAVLSQFADGVIFVVRQKDVTFEQARQAKRNLDAVNANILGVILNDFDFKHIDKTGGYYYSSYYKYGDRKR